MSYRAPFYKNSTYLSARGYARNLRDLAEEIGEPEFETEFLVYLFESRHPSHKVPENVDSLRSQVTFSESIYVHHSATARFYAPSDVCGAGGMQRETIRSNPNWRGLARYDTVFVEESDEPGFAGLQVAQVLLFIEFEDPYSKKSHSCALVRWFDKVADAPNPTTGMWKVQRAKRHGNDLLQVISVRSIVRGTHLLPVYGSGRLPEDFHHTEALTRFREYFVNPFIDYHTHELME